MFQRFSERGRQVIVFAQDESRALVHNYIGTEHILLGLLRENEGVAAKVLDSVGITLEEGRASVSRIVGRGEGATATGQIPFTPYAKKALELALRESLDLGDDHVGTEHLLLALARVNDGVTARVLRDFGVDADRVRDATVDFLSGRK